MLMAFSQQGVVAGSQQAPPNSNIFLQTCITMTPPPILVQHARNPSLTRKKRSRCLMLAKKCVMFFFVVCVCGAFFEGHLFTFQWGVFVPPQPTHHRSAGNVRRLSLLEAPRQVPRIRKGQICSQVGILKIVAFKTASYYPPGNDHISHQWQRKLIFTSDF